MERVSVTFGVRGLIALTLLSVGALFGLRYTGVLTYRAPLQATEPAPLKLSADVEELIQKLKRNPAEFLALAGEPVAPRSALAREHIFPFAALGPERNAVVNRLFGQLRDGAADTRRDAARTLGLFELSTHEMSQFLLIPYDHDAQTAAQVLAAATLNESNASRYAANIAQAVFELLEKFPDDRVRSAALATCAGITRHLPEPSLRARVRSFLFEQMTNPSLGPEERRTALQALLPLLDTNFEDLVELFHASPDALRAEILGVTAMGIRAGVFPDAAPARELIGRILDSAEGSATVFEAAVRGARESFGRGDLPRLQQALQKNTDPDRRQAISGIINAVGAKKE